MCCACAAPRAYGFRTLQAAGQSGSGVVKVNALQPHMMDWVRKATSVFHMLHSLASSKAIMHALQAGTPTAAVVLLGTQGARVAALDEPPAQVAIISNQVEHLIGIIRVLIRTV